MRLRAFAKINLGLDVLGCREDGYHEVRMVMQTIRMYDQLDLEIREEPGIMIKTNLPYLPADETNLAYQAAKLLMDEFQIARGIEIELKKVIPVAAGMAGGSSDCAAVLVGMNRLFHLGLSPKELMKRGALLGADVPYCVMRGTVLAEGIGEILTPLPPMPEGYVLIGKPGISVSTKMVYEALDRTDRPGHPDIDGILAGLEKGDFYKVAACMGNVLEEVTIPRHPVIDTIKRKMMEGGAVNAMMSGSGPTVFGLFDDKKRAEKAKELLQESQLAKQIFLTSFYNVQKR